MLFDPVSLAEAIDASGSIDQFLFASKEWMTGRTNFNLEVLYRRTGLNNIAARARDSGELVLGMYTALHAALLARRSCMPENRLYDGDMTSIPP